MNAFRVAVLLFVSTVAASFAEETSTLPATITIGGVTYSNVTWRTVTPATVSIMHKTGVASIPLEKLPPELQKRFGYDPQKAVAYLSAEQEREKAARERQRQQEQERQRQERCRDTISGNVQVVIDGGVVINHRAFIDSYIQAGGTDPHVLHDWYTFLACDNSRYAVGYEVKCRAYREGFATIQSFGKIERWVCCGELVEPPKP